MKDLVEEDLVAITKNLSQLKDRIKNKTFLVTGGAGFIGSWFCDALNSFGAKIVCVDDFSSGFKGNISRLIGNENFELIEKDVCNLTYTGEVDYIVHMACVASPPLYQKHPLKTLDTNVVATRNMLELAKKKSVKGFLFTSTSEVYGDPPDDAIPTSESYPGRVNPVGARSMYDEGKRCAETYSRFYWKEFNLPIRVARIFNTYGPRLDSNSTTQYGRVIVKFIEQALAGAPLSVYGDGSQTRSFCYITDQVEGLLKLLLSPNLDGEIVNIGNTGEMTILELANKIIALAGSNSSIEFKPLPEDDPKRRCPDLTKAKALLGFNPKIGLEDGLKRNIEWLRSKNNRG